MLDERTGVLNDRTVSQTEKFGGGGVMIWGCISNCGHGEMCQIVGNMNAALYVQILKDHLLGSIEQFQFVTSEIIFQQDNDSKHKFKLAKTFFSSNDIQVLDWPAQSPD